MGRIERLVSKVVVICGAAWLLSACVSTTDPYARAYDSCDRDAGACYADCRELDGEGRRAACQQRCTTAVNRCFAQVSDEAERYSRVRAAPDVVFYGRYGAWHPYDGYRYGRHGRRYSYNGYGYDRWGYDRWGYDRYGYDRYGYDYHGYPRRPRGAVIGPGAITRNGSGANPPRPQTPDRPSAPDDGQYKTKDGSVFSADGERLRYGGRPVREDRARSNGVRATPRTSDPTVKRSEPAKPSRPTAKPRAPRAEPEARPTRSRPRTAPRARPRTAPRPTSRSEGGKTQPR